MIPLGYQVPVILKKLAQVRNYYAQFPFVRRCAIQFGDPKQDNDIRTIAENLTAFVKARMMYVPDPHGFEYTTAPDVLLAEILQKGRAHGDCDDHVLLLNTLLCSMGFQTAFVAVKLPPEGDLFDHVVTGVNLEGQWTLIDPCAKSVIQPVYQDQFPVS